MPWDATGKRSTSMIFSAFILLSFPLIKCLFVGLCGEGAHRGKREASSGTTNSNLGKVNGVSRGVTVMENTAIGETTDSGC